jgi:hypothetical protein
VFMKNPRSGVVVVLQKDKSAELHMRIRVPG